MRETVLWHKPENPEQTFEGHLVYMIVNKLTNAKFYPKNLNSNCKPGTFVEDQGDNSFYMITQTAMQGTVNPTKYHVVENGGGYPRALLG